MEIDHSLFICSSVELTFRDLDSQNPISELNMDRLSISHLNRIFNAFTNCGVGVNAI